MNERHHPDESTPFEEWSPAYRAFLALICDILIHHDIKTSQANRDSSGTK